jgi:hypothetical protein
MSVDPELSQDSAQELAQDLAPSCSTCKDFKKHLVLELYPNP